MVADEQRPMFCIFCCAQLVLVMFLFDVIVCHESYYYVHTFSYNLLNFLVKWRRNEAYGSQPRVYLIIRLTLFCLSTKPYVLVLRPTTKQKAVCFWHHFPQNQCCVLSRTGTQNFLVLVPRTWTRKEILVHLRRLLKSLFNPMKRQLLSGRRI